MILVLLALLPSQASAAGYIVKPGDTLSLIAQRNNTTVAALARANGLGNVNLVTTGRYLMIPEGSAAAGSAAASNTRWYLVRPGDTLYGVAARFGTSAAAIRQVNPSLGGYLLAGAWLKLCGSCVSTPLWPRATGSSTTAPTARYLVRGGDTLSAIAVRYGVTIGSIATANRITDTGHIVAGAWLVIPGSPVAPTASPSVGAYDPGRARSLIVSWAGAYGISSSLALAIAWQESGYNQTLVSRTGAIGVMQVEPYTGATISRYLGRSLYLYNLDDNIHAGVFWLAHLLAYYGWNERLAIAAYYQGTKALAQFGFFADTVQYVNSVTAIRARFGG